MYRLTIEWKKENFNGNLASYEKRYWERRIRKWCLENVTSIIESRNDMRFVMFFWNDHKKRTRAVGNIKQLQPLDGRFLWLNYGLIFRKFPRTEIYVSIRAASSSPWRKSKTWEISQFFLQFSFCAFVCLRDCGTT